MPKRYFISFSGMDGTGKTSLSKRIIENFDKNGIKSRYVYGRLNPQILRPFIEISNYLFLRKENRLGEYTSYRSTKKKIIAKYRILFWVYQNILLLDCSLQLIYKIVIPRIFNMSLVCDRYIYDTVVNDISLDLDLSEENMLRLLDRFFYLFPKPDVAFLIDLPEEDAYQRKNDIPSITYLRERRNLYLTIAHKYGMIILDGSKDLNELTSIVEKRLIEV